eukprot:TRINITY_DN4217_c0_g1_i1.p1 TRINITY_DN4217_c0_g1~~TRINITY_DN4217_c0_g1_i1.p1  ORF type:complete len:245 (+),score=139.44 TRINITY_DN4217_c0_g1_i1:63-797(+)
MAQQDDVVVVDWNKRARESIAAQQGDRDASEVHVLEITDSIRDLGLLTPFTNLKELSVYQPDAPNLRLRSLEGLPAFPQLLSLELPDHLLADLPEDFAQRYPKVRRLLLSNNKFYTTESLAPLKGCACLEQLDVGDNPLVKRCLKEEVDYQKELRGMIPSLKIVDSVDANGNNVEDSDEEEDEEDAGIETEDDEEEEEEEADEDGIAEHPDNAVKRKRVADASDAAAGGDDGEGDEPDMKRQRQ